MSYQVLVAFSLEEPSRALPGQDPGRPPSAQGWALLQAMFPARLLSTDNVIQSLAVT